MSDEQLSAPVEIDEMDFNTLAALGPEWAATISPADAAKVAARMRAMCADDFSKMAATQQLSIVSPSDFDQDPNPNQVRLGATQHVMAAFRHGDTQMFANEDADALYKNQLHEIQGIDISAANFGAERQAAKQAKTGALIKGAFDVGTTILGGATQYAGLKAKMAGPKLDYDLSGF